MTPQVTIITFTYNKPTYFIECAKSVLDQTFQDWQWWIIYNGSDWNCTYEFPTDERVRVTSHIIDEGLRQRSYIPARLVNFYYPLVTTPYMCYLADDDLIDKEGLEVLWPYAKVFNHDAVYGKCEVLDEQLDGSFKHACWCFDGKDVGLGTNIPDVDCVIDSSQILHTKALWDKATADGWQLTDELKEAGHADGIWLDRLAQFATFHYVPQRINIHRRTRLSACHKPQS